MRSLKSLLLLLVLAGSAFGQVDLSFTREKSLAGATSPRIIGDRILMGADSKTSEMDVLILKVVTRATDIKVRARRTLFEDAPLESLEVKDGDPPQWLIVPMQGEYLVEVTGADEGKLVTAELKITVGPPPKPDPKPVDPKPVDPKPIDPPKPADDISNVYNVGKIAFQKAPAEPAVASTVAGFYRIGASKLYGNGGILDIKSIMEEINKKFDSQFANLTTSSSDWKIWKNEVTSALVAEQRKRGTFTRQDFYTALIEIAAALEAVK